MKKIILGLFLAVSLVLLSSSGVSALTKDIDIDYCGAYGKVSYLQTTKSSSISRKYYDIWGSGRILGDKVWSLVNGSYVLSRDTFGVSCLGDL